MKKRTKKFHSGTTWSEEINELVFTKVSTMVNNQFGRNWTGTMSNLMVALNRLSSRRQREALPGSPSALRVVINKVTNRLRSRGIGVKFGRTTDHTRTRYVKFIH
jgi:hypothetical protein